MDLWDWDAKWVLRWPDLDDWILEGTFGYSGTELVGITIYRNNKAESLSLLRKAA
jgi:hypothetical protein